MAPTTPHQLPPDLKAPQVLDALQARFGRLRRPRRDPLAVLVRGILSQNTSDVNSDRAFRRLTERFGGWPQTAAAPAGAIQDAVAVSGLAAQKAATIRRVLDGLAQRGSYSLDYLKDLPPEQAERSLRSIKGVGVKTARLVLLFGFGMPLFVVDTHVLRVAQRLRLVPERCTRQKAHVLLDTLVPDGRKYSAHMNMIRHGREICHPRNPDCDSCPVRKWCVNVRTIGRRHEPVQEP